MPDSEPLWIRILLRLYEKDMIGDSFDGHGSQKMSRKKAIADAIDGPEGDVYDAISRLEDLDLISEPPSGRESEGSRLTKDGFEVAHQVDSQRRQDLRQYQINRAVALLTLALVIVGMLQAAIVGLDILNRSHLEMELTLALGLFSSGWIIGYLVDELRSS